MGKPFRVIDTGVREGRSNIAFDAALIDLRQRDAVPDTIRFMRFPPTALIGRHQDLSREIDLAYCSANGIGTVRRMTGGGAIYLDEGQLGWELVFHRASLGIAALPDLAREICNAVAAGLSRLGVDAQFRPRNDIEVGGRKISGTGGFFDGDVLIYQGTVLIDMNAAEMVRALNVPQAKIARRDLDSAAARVTTLQDLLGDALPDMDDIKAALLHGLVDGLDIAIEQGDVTEAEESLAGTFFDDEIGTDEFVAEIDNAGADAGVLAGSHTGPGGTIDAYVKLDGPTRQIMQRVLITGDFFITPPRVILDLEADLQGVRLNDIAARIGAFFAAADIGMLSVTAEDFTAAIHSAIRSRQAAASG